MINISEGSGDKELGSGGKKPFIRKLIIKLISMCVVIALIVLHAIHGPEIKFLKLGHWFFSWDFSLYHRLLGYYNVARIPNVTPQMKSQGHV